MVSSRNNTVPHMASARPCDGGVQSGSRSDCAPVGNNASGDPGGLAGDEGWLETLRGDGCGVTNFQKKIKKIIIP